MQASRNDPTRTFQRIQILYCQAQIDLKHQHYEQARVAYQQALKQAETMARHRMIYYVQGGLAEVALAQGAFDEAKTLFVSTLEAARQNNDKRCLAFCQRPLALLEKARGNLAESRYWAEQAKKSFERLCMTQAANEMSVLLQELKTQSSQI